MNEERTNQGGNHTPAPEASLQVKDHRMKYACDVRGCFKHIRVSVTSYTDSPGSHLRCIEHADALVDAWRNEHPGFRTDADNPGLALYWATSTAGPPAPEPTDYQVEQPSLFGASESLFGAACPTINR